MRDKIHQALYGYARGHRLLASSMPLPTDAGRMLRAATDAATEAADTAYLAVLPLPEMRAQAFIRTWPAEPWLRPGSVWSHVLLVDFVVLAAADDLDAITGLFRRPSVPADSSDPDLRPYKQPLPTTGRQLSAPPPINLDLAREVLGRVYGERDRVVIAITDAARAEPTLLAIYEQQWPKLRRHFAFRTRVRPTDGPVPFDLDAVERGRVNAPLPGEPKDWLAPLLDDLAHPGGGDLRRFLRAFGPESVDGRRVLPLLVAVHSKVTAADAARAVAELCHLFPQARQMPALKRALLGAEGPSGWTPPPSWPARDPERLGLLFDAPLDAVDYTDLRVGDRLAAAVADDPAGTAAALHRLDLARLQPADAHVLVTVVANALDDKAAAALAADHPDLGVLLVAQRLALLGRPEVWDALDTDLLLEVFARAAPADQTAAERALVVAAAAPPLTILCADAPTRWWRLLFDAAAAAATDESLAREAAVLRTVLGRIGAAAVGAPDRNLTTDRELTALLLSADVSTGLWRHVRPDQWLRLWSTTAAATTARPLRDRLPALVLVAAATAAPRQLRVDAWLATFPELHRALARPDFDEEAWVALAAALPAAPEWDRCLRLRRGAVAEIRRDRWTPADADVILDGSGRYRGEMVDELRALPARKKNKHWLRELIEALLP